jgi:hypothetical protein
MTLQPIPSEFSYILGELDFLFDQYALYELANYLRIARILMYVHCVLPTIISCTISQVILVPILLVG